MGVKMVMSGEGADETLAGYLYFHKAPDGTELHEELVRKVRPSHGPVHVSPRPAHVSPTRRRLTPVSVK